MTDPEITALAREYAEETVSHTRLSTTIADDTEDVIRFLLRRYALVEKERLKRVMALHIEKSNEVAKGGETWFFHKGSVNTLQSLFPDLGKEVEG